MIPFTAPVWEKLHSAAGDVRQSLCALLEENGDFRESMNLLAEDLSHQLSFYSAVPYALPHLAALCRRLSPENRMYLLARIGPAIAAEGEVPLPPDTEPWREFQEGLEGLRPWAAELLQTRMDLLEAAPLEERQMFALGALALLGERRHAFDLYLHAGTEELPAACPECGWSEECMDFSLEEEPEHVAPVELLPWDGKTLEEESVWFPGLLERLGDTDFLPLMPYVYGTCTCPECGASGPLWQWMANFE